MKYAGDFKRITEEIGKLKERRTDLLERQDADSALNRRIQGAVNILNASSGEITEWNESVIRQLVDTVKVLSADRVLVRFRGGIEIEQTIEEARVKWCS